MINERQPQLSIIIPLFNTPEKYFIRCMNSILSASIFGVEVIIVDDGSSEKNSLVYKKFCDQYAEFKYYFQLNAGVSSARNLGIKKATGDYIIFVDGDDVVDDRFLIEGTLLTKTYNPDIIIGQIEYIPGGKRQEEEAIYVLNGKRDIDNLKCALLGIKQNVIKLPVSGSPCGRFYRTSIAKKVNFPEGIAYWEDQVFNRLFINSINTAVVTSHTWYYYYQNDFSAMHNQFNSKFIQRATPFWEVWKEINDSEKDKYIKTRLRLKDMDFFYSAVHLNIVLCNLGWKKKKNMFSELFNHPLFIDLIKNLKYAECPKIVDKLRLFLIRHQLERCIYFLIFLKHHFDKGRKKTQ